ncbi:amidohydrolase [Enterococcus camelliae]|uniref:Amidohydrolase n=1 Tax=Enterococcus camelliae TaxID=453959 RepID=A0ABW5TL16_9ENTE
MRKIIHSKAIFDVDQQAVFAGYLVIEKDIIVAIYKEDEWNEPYHGDFFDFGDQMIVPGFIDAHIHFYLSALLNSGKLKQVGGKTENEVAKQVEDIPTVAGWKIGIGWFSSDFGQNIYPSHQSIDRICADVPVMLIAGDAHSVWFNQCGMDTLAIVESTLPVDLSGDARKENGELTGCFTEAMAIHYLAKVLQLFMDTASEDYLSYMKQLNTMGITTVGDVALTGESWDDFVYPEIYQSIEKSATLRVNFYPAMREDTQELEKLALRYQSDWVQFGGVKQFFDGVTSTHTAFLKEEYATPYFPKDCGAPLLPLEQMCKLIFKANQKGWPIRIHTIGDQAIHQALCYYQESEQKFPLKPGHYNTLEHLEVMDPQDLSLTNQQQLVISVQPSHLLVGYETLDEEVGQKRANEMFPFRSLLKNNPSMAFGTDSPVVVNVSPLETIYYAVARRDKKGLPEKRLMPKETLSVGQAITAHTSGSAKALSRDDIGKIACGKKADLCVISKNLLKITERELLECTIVKTMVAGEWV